MLIEIENLAPQVLSEIDLTEKLLALLEDYLVDPLVAGGALIVTGKQIGRAHV